MFPYLLPPPTPLIPLQFTSNGSGTHGFVPVTVRDVTFQRYVITLSSYSYGNASSSVWLRMLDTHQQTKKVDWKQQKCASYDQWHDTD
jgi:hypothetical protein